MLKKCEFCNEEYNSKGRQRYCSKECKKMARNKREKGVAECEYCKKDFIKSDKRQKYCRGMCRELAKLQRMYEATQERNKGKICIECGKVFDGVKADQMLCSEECRIERNKKRNRENKVEVVCKYCNKTAMVRKGSKYCCLECYRKDSKRVSREGEREEYITCRYCGKVSESKRIGQIYCDSECHSNDRKRVNIEKYGVSLPMNCGYCNKEIIKNFPHQKYCSHRCARMSAVKRSKE